MIDYIVLLIFIVSIYYTFKYKFIQVKCFKKTKEVLVKKRSKTAYQTFVVGLASCVGVGNIIGVTSAIIVGGPGSIFWMIVFAFFASVFSVIENTLGVKYKVKINGEYRGGSPYYILEGLGKRKTAILIAVFLVLTNTVLFQPLQVNTLSESIHVGFNISYYIIFLIISLFAILFIFSGTKKIVSFSEKIVPFMSLSFIMISIVVILINIERLPNVIGIILKEAFNFKSIFCGGIFVGLKRSLFSHEAGLGTMPTISAMSDVDKPIDQGFVQCFGVFFDTVIMCTLTGLMILCVGVNIPNQDGYELVINVFIEIFNNDIFGKYVAVIFMFMFSLATIVSQYYLGESNLIFITNKKERKNIVYLYRCLYLVGIFIGVFLSIKQIWNIIDYGILGIGMINIYSIIKLRKEFEVELFDIKNVTN